MVLNFEGRMWISSFLMQLIKKKSNSRAGPGRAGPGRVSAGVWPRCEQLPLSPGILHNETWWLTQFSPTGTHAFSSQHKLTEFFHRSLRCLKRPHEHSTSEGFFFSYSATEWVRLASAALCVLVLIFNMLTLFILLFLLSKKRILGPHQPPAPG